jgi:hypothetical protein
VELKDLLDLHEKLESRVNAYWTYWSVAVVAIGGPVRDDEAAGRGPRRDRGPVRQQSFASPKLTVALAEDAMRFRMELTVVMHLVIDAIVIGMLLTAGR